MRNVHKLAATGNLVSNTAHDILNHLTSIGGYIKVLWSMIPAGGREEEMLKSIERLKNKSCDLLYRLSRFSHQPQQKLAQTDINKTIEDASEDASAMKS